MEIQVYDTHITRKDSYIMHFDVFLDKATGSPAKAVVAGRKYLNSVGETAAIITSKECMFCHVQSPTYEQVEAIEADGYFIYKMNNCL